MDRIFEISERLIANEQIKLHRSLYGKIAWEDDLIMIKGARGVGKTTMMLQRAKEINAFVRTESETEYSVAGNGGEIAALYASLDQLWFNDHTITELADFHYKHGGTHLFLDEVHLYPGISWEQELKNIHDSYPGYHVVFTGSSLLQLNRRTADLSRRVAIYMLPGMSFREYLMFKGRGEWPAYGIEELLQNHVEIASEITRDLRIMGEFGGYLEKGFYPFFMSTSEFTYSQRVERLVLSVIDIDIPAVADIEYETQLKLKKLLVILSEQVPFVPNISKLSKDVGVTRNQLMKLFTLLCDAAILRSLYDTAAQPKNAAKPAKLLFDNPSVMQALGVGSHKGTVRESFAASMLSNVGKVYAAKDGDFLLDKKYTFEVGGSWKGYAQIAGKPDSFVLADDIETGIGSKMPLWLLGFLY